MASLPFGPARPIELGELALQRGELRLVVSDQEDTQASELTDDVVSRGFRSYCERGASWLGLVPLRRRRPLSVARRVA